MGFWNNYFKLGLGDKFRETLGNILLRNKFNDLLEKYKKSPYDSQNDLNEDGLQPPLQQIQPTQQQEIQGDPKQDIKGTQDNITGNTGYIGAGGLPDDKEKPNVTTDNETTDTDNTTDQIVQPTAIESMLSQRDYGTTDSKIIPHDKRNQVDNQALQILLDPDKRRQHNEKLRNDVMEYLLYSTRFSNPEKFQNMANMLLTSKTIGDPKIPEFDHKASFTDKNGKLYRYEYNMYQQKYVPVPVTDKFGVQIQTKLPEIRDLSKLNYYKGGNGNAFYKDPDTGEDVDTGVLYEDWNTEYGLDLKKLDLMERKFQQGTTNNTTGKRRSYTGTSDGQYTGIGDGQYLIDVNTGLPIKPIQRTIQTNNFEIVGYNEDGTPQYKPETKTENGYMLNGKFVPASEIDQFITGMANKKTGAYNKMLLKQLYGVDIGTDKTIDKVYNDRKTWIQGNIDIINDPYATPEKKQKAIQWLKDNNKYNKDINVIDDELYNDIEDLE